MALKVFVFGGVLLALDAAVHAFGGNVTPVLDQFLIIVGSIAAVLGGTFYILNR